MNTAELADKLIATHGLTKISARKSVDELFSTIVGAVISGEEVSLSGFGKFKLKQSPAREGRNPATGEAITIAATKKLSFIPAKAVKDRMNK